MLLKNISLGGTAIYLLEEEMIIFVLEYLKSTIDDFGSEMENKKNGL